MLQRIVDFRKKVLDVNTVLTFSKKHPGKPLRLIIGTDVSYVTWLLSTGNYTLTKGAQFMYDWYLKNSQRFTLEEQ